MLQLRRANRRNRGYTWFKLRTKKHKGFLHNARRPSTKVH